MYGKEDSQVGFKDLIFSRAGFILLSMNRLRFQGSIFDIGIILLFGIIGCFLCFCQDEKFIGASMWVFLVSIISRLFGAPWKYLIPIYCISLVLFIIGLVYLFDAGSSDQVQWPSS